MNVAVLDPVVGRLRRRRSLVHADAARLACEGPHPAPVGELLESLETELASLLSLDARAEQDPVARALWLQHETLRRHAESIDALLDLMLHFESSTPWQRASARLLLDDFSRELSDHLCFEEQNGCLERAAEAEPRFTMWVVALRDEHQAFRDRAAWLAEVAQDAGSTSSDWEPLRQAFEELREALRSHEQAEAELLHGAYLEDLGGSG